MNKLVITIGILSASFFGLAQEETKEGGDTTKVKVGKIQVLIVDPMEETVDFSDSIDIEGDEDDGRNNEAHWAGLDFGFNMLMNSSFKQEFGDDSFLKNNIGKSQVWNLNLLEHKFKIVKEYVGLTTGLGFSFTQIGINNNYVLRTNADTTFAVLDTVNNYSKNKLKASYVTVPLLLEFNTNKDNDKGFYLATGVVGGYKIGSRYKQIYEVNGDRVKSIKKDDYNLNPFKLDATVRLGHDTWGAFINYSLLPVFNSGATKVEAFPLTAGLTLNF